MAKTLSEKDAKLKELERESILSENRIKELEKEVSELKNFETQLMKETDRLHSKVEELKKENVKLSQASEKRSSNSSDFERDVHILTLERGDLIQRLQSSQSELLKVKKERDKLTEENRDFVSSNTTVQGSTALEVLKERNLELEKRIEKKHVVISELQSEIDRMTVQGKNNEKMIEELQTETQRWSDEKKDILGKKADVESALKNLEKDCESKNAHLLEQKSIIAKLTENCEKEVVKNEEQQKLHQKEIKSLQEKLEDKKREVLLIEEQNLQEMKNTEVRMKEVEDANKALQTNLNFYIEKNLELSLKFNRISKEKLELAEKLENFQGKNAHINKEIKKQYAVKLNNEIQPMENSIIKEATVRSSQDDLKNNQSNGVFSSVLSNGSENLTENKSEDIGKPSVKQTNTTSKNESQKEEKGIETSTGETADFTPINPATSKKRSTPRTRAPKLTKMEVNSTEEPTKALEIDLELTAKTESQKPPRGRRKKNAEISETEPNKKTRKTRKKTEKEENKENQIQNIEKANKDIVEEDCNSNLKKRPSKSKKVQFSLEGQNDVHENSVLTQTEQKQDIPKVRKGRGHKDKVKVFESDSSSPLIPMENTEVEKSVETCTPKKANLCQMEQNVDTDNLSGPKSATKRRKRTAKKPVNHTLLPIIEDIELEQSTANSKNLVPPEISSDQVTAATPVRRSTRRKKT